MVRIVAQCEDPFQFGIEFNREPSLWLTTDESDGVAGTTVQYRTGDYVGDWNLYWSVDEPTMVSLSSDEREQPGLIRDINIARTALARYGSLTLMIREHQLKTVTSNTRTANVCPWTRALCLTPTGYFERRSRGCAYANSDFAFPTVQVPVDQPYSRCVTPPGVNPPGRALPGRDGVCIGQWQRRQIAGSVCPGPSGPPLPGVESVVNTYKEHTITFDLSGNTCRE